MSLVTFPESLKDLSGGWSYICPSALQGNILTQLQMRMVMGENLEAGSCIVGEISTKYLPEVIEKKNEKQKSRSQLAVYQDEV